MEPNVKESGVRHVSGDAIFAFLVSSCFAGVVACGPVAAFSFLFGLGRPAMAVAMAAAFLFVSGLLSYGLMVVRKSSLLEG